MTPDQARKRARRLEQDLLVAEAEQAALGWMYLTVEGIDIESEPDLERYLRCPKSMISYRNDNGAWLNAAEDHALALATPAHSPGWSLR